MSVLYALRRQNADQIRNLPETEARAVYAWLCSFRDDVSAKAIKGAFQDLRQDIKEAEG